MMTSLHDLKLNWPITSSELSSIGPACFMEATKTVCRINVPAEKEKTILFF